MAKHLSITKKNEYSRIKAAFALQLFCTSASALPSLETTSLFAECIVATQISYAELRMTGQHSNADTFQKLSRRLYSEIKAAAFNEQESNYIESILNSEFSTYQRMNDKQQLRYAIHVLERNQCNRLRL